MKRTTQKIPKHAVRDNARLQLVSTPTDRRNPKIRDKIENDLKFIERKIVMSMIVDDDFCQWAVDNLDFRLLESPELKMIAGWVTEYFRDFGQRAPRRDIESIYTTQLQSGLDREKAEFVEMILESLSNEYEQVDLNIQYLKHLTDRWKQKRQLEQKVEDVTDLLRNNELEDAVELFNLEPSSNDGDYTEFQKHTVSYSELKDMKIQEPKAYLSPWLREGEINIIYARMGTGKSLLATHLMWVCSCQNYQEEECEINNWQVKHPVGTLFIDGELGPKLLYPELKKFEWLGDSLPGIEPVIVFRHEWEKADKQLDLSKRSVQNQIIRFFELNPDYKILIMDSLSTLFQMDNENDNSEFHNKIQPFLVRLKAHNITGILIDHAGKNGTLRGASAKGTIAANIIKLTDHPQKRAGEAWFEINFKDKQRMAGVQNKPFFIKYRSLDGRTEFEITSGDSTADKTKQIMAELMRGKKNKEIAERFGIKAPRVTAIKNTAIDKGFMDKKGRPTDLGFGLLKQLETDGLDDD